MKEPTKEQIQWLWEQRGFGKDSIGNITYPGSTDSQPIYGGAYYPPIDLNNLFKYAPDYQQIIFQPQYCGITIDDKLYEGIGETEEVAFFWAVYKALVEKR